MKKTIALLTLSLMLLSLFTACSNSDKDKKKEAETTTEAATEAALTPSANLPSTYSEVFNTYLDYSLVAKRDFMPKVNEMMGLVLAAYESYTSEQFCKYVCSAYDNNIFSDIYDDMGEVAKKLGTLSDDAENRKLAELSLERLDFLPATAAVVNDITSIKGLAAGASAADYNSEKTYLVAHLNTLSEFIYGVALFN